MGTTLHGYNKKNGNFDLNYWGRETLNYLGNGLKKKYGVYAPMSKEDCLILARILHNKANLLKIMAADPEHSLQKAMNFRMIMLSTKEKWDYMNDDDTIDWIHNVATWFENCGGLRPEYGIGEE